jgi:hypothetical protein
MGQPDETKARHPRVKKIARAKGTRGTETSKYPQERTSTETPLVVANERGRA